jgi:hypothetical protein
MRPCVAVFLATTWLLTFVARADAGGRQAGAPVVAEVRIHGNHTTPDADVLRIAQLAEGQAADTPALDAARRRLEQSGLFESVEILTRYRSLADTGNVAVVILVTERALVTVTDAGIVRTPGPLARLRRNTMFLPILRYEDGYGLTYGVRFSVVGSRQSATRVSAPLSWGGERQAAVEASHTFERGVVSRVSGRAGVSRREHPFFDRGETRTGVSGEVLKRFGPVVGVGLTAARTDVRFGEHGGGHLDSIGGFAELDTRRTPTFPRNAVYVRSEIARLRLSPAAGVVRAMHDARGYVGLPRGSVLAVRAQATTTGGAVPDYAKAFVGGAGSLRGWRAGTAVGDNAVAASAELRVPLSSPASLTRPGIAAFYDVAAAYDHGARWRDQRFARGAGVGFFVAAPVFGVRLDVAKGIGGATRVHFSTGIGF